MSIMLYGCETWSLTLRVERRLRVFENRVEENTNIVRVIKSRRVRWAGHVARMGEERGVYRFLLGKP